MRAAALLAAFLAAPLASLASACHPARAGAFEEVPLQPPPRRSHRWAHACMAAGTGLVLGSFAIAQRANDRYDEYLAATEPPVIARLYDETVHLDRLSSASLLGGELLIAAGLYLRFLRRPVETRVAVLWTPGRCAVSWRF